jgi:anti-anti-sigma regulatory factor
MVAANSGVALVRIIGRGTFMCSQSLRDFGSQSISSGIKKLIIDLSECDGMDSTFMGVLAMLAQQDRSVGVEICNADDYKKKLLAGLGIKRLFCFAHTDTDDITWQTLLEAKADDPLARGRVMLEAHETLIDADPENVPKFKDVVDFLRLDIQEQSEATE